MATTDILQQTDQLKQFCYRASYRVMQGLQQEIGLRPGTHYQARGKNSARVLTLLLQGLNPHYLNQVMAMQDQLGMWAGLDRNKQRIRVSYQGTTVLVEIPKPMSFWAQITLERLEQQRAFRRGPVITLGEDLYSRPCRVDFKEAAIAHMFITGQTRSGKTNAQQLVVWNLVHNTNPGEAGLLIFDVAKGGHRWREFDQVTHLMHPVVTEVREAEQAITWLAGQINARKNAPAGTRFQKIFIVIDELKALIDDSDLAAPGLARLASVGGEFGLHLIAATQYPQIKMLGSAELKRNITTRLCGKVDDGAAAVNALGISESGAERLQGYGDFLLKDFDGLSRLTVAHVQPHHITALPRSEARRLPLDDEPLPDQAPEPTSHPSHQPDPLDPRMVAVELLEGPYGIQKLRRVLREYDYGSPGIKKLRRVKEFAADIRAWAAEHDKWCLD